MALEIAEPADHQWESDLVALFGLDVAGDPGAQVRRRRGGQSVRMYFPLIAVAVLVASIPALILLERRLAPETANGGSSAVRRGAAATLAMPSASAWHHPDVLPDHVDEASALIEKPSSRRSSPADEQSRAVARVGLRPNIGPQPLAGLSAEPARRAETPRTYAYAPKPERSMTAIVLATPSGTRGASDALRAIQSVADPATAALPSTDVARSDLPKNHALTSKAASADVGSGNGPPSGTFRQPALSGAVSPIGVRRTISSVASSPGQTSSDKVKAKDKNRRTDAIDALWLLRRQ